MNEKEVIQSIAPIRDEVLLERQLWTDDEFLSAFEACTIPKVEWTHRAHVRMAWLYLRKHDPEQAMDLIRSGIKRYNAATGGPANGYHETVTWAYTRLIHERMRRSDCPIIWPEFETAYPELFDRVSPPTLQHYRRETLMSQEARTSLVAPDLEPLP